MSNDGTPINNQHYKILQDLVWGIVWEMFRPLSCHFGQGLDSS